MKALPFWFVALASLFALVGMAWGIQMSMTQNFDLAPAHAHNNLIGFVSMTIYGFYYKLVPAAAVTRLALAHFWLSALGAATFGVGIAMAISGQGEILAIIASLLTILGALVFAVTVFRNRAGLTV